MVLYDVVLNFEKYPEFLPDAKKVTTLKTKPLTVSFEISVIKKVRYTLSFKTIPGKKISWSFVEGDFFKDNHGSWLFEEVKKGQTKATYHIEVDFGLFVPSIITDKLAGRSLPKMMERFKKRAEGLI